VSVLVTGARGAIGSACVDQFVAAGETVIAQDLDTSGSEWHPSVIPVSGDLLDDTVLRRLAELSDETGLTAVVAAHGIAGSAALLDCSDDFVSRVLSINWSTIPLLFDAVRGRLKASSGSFIAIASQAALIGEAENTAYCAAKFAVNGWVQAQAALADGYTVHALCPGATNSPLLFAAQKKFALAEGVSPDAYYRARTTQISLGRYGEPREIAAAAAYLAQPGPRPVVLAVTGGDILL
jgi:NAD(P)-dependent dehydrogenase (short-subunit alcohol dehydrogenase family)